MSHFLCCYIKDLILVLYSCVTAVNSLSSVSSGFDSDDDDSGKKKNKRGVLPKSATQIMKSWLFQHIVVSLKHKLFTISG